MQSAPSTQWRARALQSCGAARAALAWGVAGLVLGLALLSPAALLALSERELDAEVQRISDMLRCPTCQGISVKDSEAAFSRQIKDKVRRMVQEGQTEEQIKAFFVSRYGEWILRAPKKEGIGLVLWLAPGAAMLGVGGWIGYRLWRNTREAREETADTGDTDILTPEQRARIDRDLQRFETEED